KGLVIRSFSVRCSYPHQLFYGKTHNFRSQKSNKLYVLRRVIYHIEKRQKSFYLHSVKETVIVIYVGGDVVFCQNLVKNVSVVFYTPHQYNYIPLAERSFFTRLAVKERRAEIVPDYLNSGQRFFFGFDYVFQLVIYIGIFF